MKQKRENHDRPSSSPSEGVVVKKPFLGAVVLLVALATYNLFQAPAVTPVVDVEQQPTAAPRIQVALSLDTSGSMDGLLEQAKSQLWKVVNEFGSANHNGQLPIIEVALFEYGKTTVPASQGFVRKILGLTSDLDRVSEELFALETNGGDEYCGWAIQSALDQLEWSQRSQDLKILFIAGNEEFHQGPVSYQTVCSRARQQGVLINTIFCGNGASGEAYGWQDGARLGQGQFAAIDHNAEVVHIQTPQDQQIAQLGQELNQTYVPYGDLGAKNHERQSVQDKKSEAVHSSVARSVTKASASYRNHNWDLVDACEEGTVDLADLDADELPAPMQSMNERERLDYVNRQKSRRDQLKSKIQKLQGERKKYLAGKRAEVGEQNTLDEAMVETVRLQATQNGYQFK